MKFIIALLLLSQAGCALMSEQPYRDAYAKQQAARTPDQIKHDNIVLECVRQANAGALTAQGQTHIVNGCMAANGL